MRQEVAADRKLKIACEELKEPHWLSNANKKKPYEIPTHFADSKERKAKGRAEKLSHNLDETEICVRLKWKERGLATKSYA